MLCLVLSTVLQLVDCHALNVHVYIMSRLLLQCNQNLDSYGKSLLIHCTMHAQVSRTDANALIALDPVDLTVTRKFDYTAILPEAKVRKACFLPLLLLPVLAMLCGLCNADAGTISLHS